MMEMAETASLNTPRLNHSQPMLHIAEVHHSSGASSPESGGSPVMGSRELLIPGVSWCLCACVPTIVTAYRRMSMQLSSPRPPHMYKLTLSLYAQRQSQSGTQGESKLLVSHSAAAAAPRRRQADKGREPDEAFVSPQLPQITLV